MDRFSMTCGVDEEDGCFRATHLWQELIVGFRVAMPCCRHRIKMRYFENSFIGKEAVDWMHAYLQTTGKFGTVTRQQTIKLLEKFCQNDVIEEVRGKSRTFEDNTCIYRFVKEPGPFNFINDVHMASPRPVSPLGKHDRNHSPLVHSRKDISRSSTVSDYNGACFANRYAFQTCDEQENDPTSMVTSPSKKCRSDNLVTKNLAVRVVNSQTTKLTPEQVATIWKETTLARILKLVDLPELESVLAHDAVDGNQILTNVSTLGCKERLSKAVTMLYHSIPNFPTSQYPHTPTKKDRRPPLPTPTHRHKLHTLTTTHHYKRRFSTKINSDLRSPMASRDRAEAVTDVPQWVSLAMNCLSKWPDGCTEELVGDMPVYCGLELDVLQSLVKYFRSISDPLISVKLYDLHNAVLSLLVEGKAGVLDALQLCSLLLPLTNRTRLHRILCFIYDASTNCNLHLSKTHTNKDILLTQFASIIVRSETNLTKVGEAERAVAEKLVEFMAQHYQEMFEIPEDMRIEVQKRLAAITAGEGGDIAPDMKDSFCHRLTSQQYSSQSKDASYSALLDLLDRMIADETMTSKNKKRKLKEFKQAYPGIYSERFSVNSISPPDSSRRQQHRNRKQPSFKRNKNKRQSPLPTTNHDSGTKNVILR